MTYAFHPDALAEHLASSRFYERKQQGLGEMYIVQIEQCAEAVAQHPQRFRRVEGSDVRHAPVARFPYTLYFRSREGRIEILAVAHNRRKPGYWKGRG